MKDIQRYEYDGTRADEPYEYTTGEYVLYEDHAAIVAALQEQVHKLVMFKDAFDVWHDKTDWVQTDKRFDVLVPWGKHRADVLKEYIERLEEQVEKLAAENSTLIGWVEMDSMSKVEMTDFKATDAVIREIGAKAIEVFGDYIKLYHSDSSRSATGYAAQLRAGGVS